MIPFSSRQRTRLRADSGSTAAPLLLLLLPVRRSHCACRALEKSETKCIENIVGKYMQHFQRTNVRFGESGWGTRQRAAHIALRTHTPRCLVLAQSRVERALRAVGVPSAPATPLVCQMAQRARRHWLHAIRPCILLILCAAVVWLGCVVRRRGVHGPQPGRRRCCRAAARQVKRDVIVCECMRMHASALFSILSFSLHACHTRPIHCAISPPPSVLAAVVMMLTPLVDHMPADAAS